MKTSIGSVYIAQKNNLSIIYIYIDILDTVLCTSAERHIHAHEITFLPTYEHLR